MGKCSLQTYYWHCALPLNSIMVFDALGELFFCFQGHRRIVLISFKCIARRKLQCLLQPANSVSLGDSDFLSNEHTH
jgi:hypothetical protein